MTNAAPPPLRALITGGTSGIGLATAMKLARSGPSRIVINGRNRERGEAALHQLAEAAPNATLHFVPGDFSSQDEVERLVQEASVHLDGGFDVLVNAAGGDFAPKLFHETSLEELDGIVRHWLLGTMYCCRLALPLMGEGGSIVNVASDAAKVPTPGEAAIGAAMAGITMFSRTLALEAKRRKIRVNVVTPSLVRNTLSHDRITADGFSAKLFAKAAAAAHLGVAEPEDVAAVIAFLAGPDTKRVTGQVLSINGGISAG
jgi:2-hydroxycyclohexanecarboxyl-CoA dehydrogenase